MPVNLSSMSPAEQARYLSSLPGDQNAMIEMLRQQYGNIGAISQVPTTAEYGNDPAYNHQYTATGFSGAQTPLELQPQGDGRYRANLTSAFDPQEPGGRYGNYTGAFDQGGSLDPASVSFQPSERDWGWIDNHIPDMAKAVMIGSVAGGLSTFDPSSLFGAGATEAAGYTPFIPELAGDAYLAGGLPAEFTAGAGVVGPEGFMGFGDGATMGGWDASAGVGGSTAPQVSLAPQSGGWVSGADLPSGPMIGTDASGFVANSGGLGGATKAASGLLDSLGGTKGLATIAGGLAGALGSGSNTATSSKNVPEWAQQYGPDLVKTASDYAHSPFQPYTGQRFAGPNDATKNSWEMANQIAQGPSAGQQVAQGTFNRLQSGQAPGFGDAERVGNQYIGQTTPGATNQYIGQTTKSNVSALAGGQNPYLNQTTGAIDPLAQMNLSQSTTDVGRNALLGQNNPYLKDAIGYAAGDITRNYDNTINPQLARMDRASGSFGNSGVQQAREEAQRTLANQIGRTTNDMRMADYNLQAQLGEGDLGRRTNAALTDAQRNLGASKDMQSFNIGTDLARQQANLGYRAGDLGRNIAASEGYQNRVLDAGKFDATMANNDLTRNANLAQNLGQFNATLGQGDLARNASLTGQQQQFNAGQGNFDITGARNDWNSAESRAAQTMNAYQGFDQAATNRAALLGTAGADMNRYAQQPLDFNFSEFQRQQQDIPNKLGTYGQMYGAGVNGQSVQSTPTGNSPAANLIGGATTAAGLWNLFNSGSGAGSNANYQYDPITGRRYA